MMSPRGQGANTPTRPIRVDLELWDRFGRLAEPDRSAVLREFMRWYVREPGSRAPKRPALASGHIEGTSHRETP